MGRTSKKNTASNIKGIIIAIFLVTLVLFYFQHLSNRTVQRKTDEQKNELVDLCEYDMILNYPKTARDVIKLHNRYFKVLYTQSVDDEELSMLNQKVRCLYSQELLSYNPDNASLDNLKKSIETMKSEKYTYKSYELPEASQIKYYKQKGVEMATTEVKLNLSFDGDLGYVYIQYVLVNENDQWKILAWGESELGHASE